MSYRTWSEEKFRERMETLAREAAARHYQRQNPEAAPEDVEQYAGRYWREFVGVAADIVALWETVDEADAAPGN